MSIRLLDTTDRKSAGLESYPYDSILADGVFSGSKTCGHGDPNSFDVHVKSRSPFNPWTNTMLADKTQSAFSSEKEHVCAYSTVGLSGSTQILTPYCFLVNVGKLTFSVFDEDDHERRVRNVIIEAF